MSKKLLIGFVLVYVEQDRGIHFLVLGENIYCLSPDHAFGSRSLGDLSDNPRKSSVVRGMGEGLQGDD